MYIALVAEEDVKRKDSSGKDITETSEVYRDGQILEGKRAHYEKGVNNLYSFEISVQHRVKPAWKAQVWVRL